MEESKSQDKYWLKSAILTVLQNLSGVLFGLGSFLFLVRILKPEEFGIWGLFVTTTTLLEMIRNGLVGSSLIKYLAGSFGDIDKGKVITASFFTSMIITVVVITVNLIFAQFLGKLWKSDEVVTMFHLFNIVFLFSGLLSMFNGIEQANFSFKGIFASSVIRQGIFFLYVAVCFFFKIKVELIHLVYVQIVMLLGGTFAAYWAIKDYLVFAREIDYPQIKKMFHFGKYAFGTSVSSMLSVTVDQWMLGGIISPKAAAAFNIAGRINNLVDVPTNAIATIVFPQSAKRIETEGKEAIKYLYEKSVGTVLAILIPSLIFLFIFPDFVVSVITSGDKYKETIPILRVTAIYCLFIPFGRQFGTMLDSIGKTKITFYIVVIAATTNLTLNYIFISNIGIMGAPYATLLSNIIGFIIAQIILRRELNVNFLNAFVYAVKFYPEFYNKYVKRKK